MVSRNRDIPTREKGENKGATQGEKEQEKSGKVNPKPAQSPNTYLKIHFYGGLLPSLLRDPRKSGGRSGVTQLEK